jgi:hypothetical protein
MASRGYQGPQALPVDTLDMCIPAGRRTLAHKAIKPPRFVSQVSEMLTARSLYLHAIAWSSTLSDARLT